MLPIIGEHFLPAYAVSSFIALSVVILCLSALGFIAGALESKTAIEAYGFILLVATLVMGVFALLLNSYSNLFDEYYDRNWGDVMIYVHRNFFTPEYMGCHGGKYRDNQ